jgi:hypothetical protein
MDSIFQLASWDWRFINTFAPWLAAFGSILASLVAVRLANQQRKVQLIPSLEYATVYPLGEPVRVLIFEVVNIGHRPGRVHCLELRTGWPKPRRSVPIPDPAYAPLSTRLPVTLADGETANCFFSVELIRTLLADSCRTRVGVWVLLRRLRAVARTTTGKEFHAPLGRFLKRAMWRKARDGSLWLEDSADLSEAA